MGKPENKISPAEILGEFESLSIKEQEEILELAVQGVNLKLIYKRMEEDPQGQEAVNALRRLGANTVISILDFIPGVGLLASGSADALKIKWLRKILNLGLKHLKVQVEDLTPDVSKKIAYLTELLEIPFFGTAPTHFVETTIQTARDIPRFKRGLKAYKRLKEEERKKYEKFGPVIREAKNKFK